MTYLDNYIEECRPSPNSIQRTGTETIGGQNYPHTVSQTANEFTTWIPLSGNAKRFQATVGLVTASALPDATVQFELLATMEGGNETQLYVSDVLGHGRTDPVDESLVGVVRIGLRAISVDAPGGLGTAGWGDAKITGDRNMTCP